MSEETGYSGYARTMLGPAMSCFPFTSLSVISADGFDNFGIFGIRSSSSKLFNIAFAASSMSLLFRFAAPSVLVRFAVLSKAFVSRALESHEVEALFVRAAGPSADGLGARNDLRRGEGAGSPVKCDILGFRDIPGTGAGGSSRSGIVYSS